MRQGIQNGCTCMDHSSCCQCGYAVGKERRCKGLRRDRCAGCCGSGCRCHQDAGQRGQYKGRHVHGFQEVRDVILQCGRLDDPCDGAGSDQKDGDADDLAETKFHILHAVLDLAGCDHTDETAYRKRDQRIDGNACDGAKRQHDDDDDGAKNSRSESGQILLAGALHVAGCDLIAGLFAQDRREENGHNQREDRGNGVAHHNSSQIL